MSTQYRDPPRWAQNSLKEAEVAHFRQLQGVQALLGRITAQVNRHLDEQRAAIEGGMNPAVAMFGHRACGLQPNGEPLPEKPAVAAETKTPAKPRPYKPRIYAPPMLALGARIAQISLELAPLILEQWEILVKQCGVDPRRLALDAEGEEIAALMLDEIGVQYHEIDANDHEKVREALDRVQAWMEKAKTRKPFGAEEGPAQSGPPEAEAAAPAQADPPQSEPATAGAAPQSDVAVPAASAEGATPDDGPDTAGERPTSQGRDAAPYSASGNSLDWTKL